MCNQFDNCILVCEVKSVFKMNAVGVLIRAGGEGGCVGELTTAGAGPAPGYNELLPDVYLSSSTFRLFAFLLIFVQRNFFCLASSSFF